MNVISYKSFDDCIPEGEDFQNWFKKLILKIHPELVRKLPEPENEEEDDEIQEYCYMCYNMNTNLNITCYVCDKIYCKSHSYCVLGNNDMYYCSKFCFLNC